MPFMIPRYLKIANECLPFLFKYDKIITTRGISMKNFLCIFGLIGACFIGNASWGISAGTVGDTGAYRGLAAGSATATSQLRGNSGVAEAYKTNQRNTYFMVTQPDVDTACRQKIYACLAEYCGDVTVVPGQRESKCKYATESELYNYALLCLQKDTEILLPQYGVNTVNGKGGMNTAARLCPSYVQQELLSYLSMANMATQLSKSNSDLCLLRRQELEAAMACHSVALAYGNETDSMLVTMLTDYCGSGIPGGSAEMVTRFANAGNVGSNIWGWAEKMVGLDMNSRGANWQSAVDAVLAGYTNRMNLACGDNMQLNLASQGTTKDATVPTALQTVAALALGASFPEPQRIENPFENQSLYMDITSQSRLDNYQMAQQVVMAGLSNSAITQNAFLTSADMDNMQKAYKLGTKVFILRDNARCFIVPVTTLTTAETSVLAQSFAGCLSK